MGDSAVFIVSITYTRPLDQVDRHLDAHRDWLKQQYAAGYFLASGRKVPRTGGVILSTVDDRERLQAIIAGDPFRLAGVADYEVTEFVPNLVADGFEALLGGE